MEGAAEESSHAKASGSENAVGYHCEGEAGRACRLALLRTALDHVHVLVHGHDCARHHTLVEGVLRKRDNEQVEGRGGRRGNRVEDEAADALPHVGLENKAVGHLDSHHGEESDHNDAEGEDEGGDGGLGALEGGSDGNPREGKGSACALGLGEDLALVHPLVHKGRPEKGEGEAWMRRGRGGGKGWDRHDKRGAGVDGGVMVVEVGHADDRKGTSQARDGGHGGQHPCPDGCGR